MSFWRDNPGAEDALRKLWKAGKSTIQIAAELGCGRNAVIGKAHRMGLPQRPTVIVRTPPEDIRRMEKLLREGNTAASVARTLGKCPKTVSKYAKQNGWTFVTGGIVPPRKKKAEKPKGCEWPFGDPRTANYHECGAKPVKHQPYCEDHLLASVRKEHRPALKRAIKAIGHDEKGRWT